MQEAICGIKPKTSFDQESDDELPDLAELGITDNQQRQLGLLFYVLYGNSAVLYSPNSSLINDVISKANSTFILLDTITKYAYEWQNVSKVLKTYFRANGTEKKIESLRKVIHFLELNKKKTQFFSLFYNSDEEIHRSFRSFITLKIHG